MLITRILMLQERQKEGNTMSINVLFQGDSITDVGRDRERPNDLGRGYPMMLAAQLSREHPRQYSFINRGISGNRVVDIYARIKRDALNLHPDVLSLLVGINDVWHEVFDQNGVDAEKYERVYDWMLTEIREANPDIKLMLMAPFVLPGSVTSSQWEVFQAETNLRVQAVKRLANKHGGIYIPLQPAFDKALSLAPPEYWLHDGVHPTPAGHVLIAEEWRKAWDSMGL